MDKSGCCGLLISYVLILPKILFLLYIMIYSRAMVFSELPLFITFFENILIRIQRIF